MITFACLALTVALVGFLAFRVGASGKTCTIVGLVGLTITIGQMGIYYIPQKHSGHVTMKLGDPLESGQLIAFEGQRGEQAKLLDPGLGWNWQYPFLMEIESIPDVNIPSGQFAVLKARDGAINPEIVAPKWDTSLDREKMLQDVAYFMENGGSRGVQQEIMTTGNYRINQFQWSFKTERMRNVRSNEVLVIESKFGKSAPFTETSNDEILSVPLVDSEDYRGIVNKALPSGLYPIHPYTQEGHSVPINLQTFIYGGGYTSNIMDLRIDPENDKLITVEDQKQYPSQKHGDAFAAKTKDNHTVYIDVRVLGQIEPIQAPRFIGTIKETSKLDDDIIEPYTKTILTNLVLKYQALDLKEKKEELGVKLSEALRERTKKTGYRTKTVEITNIDIPPIVLIPEKIASASDALKTALVKKEASVKQAIKVRNMQEQADSQKALAEATVANKAADETSKQIIKLADAEKYRQQTIADSAKYHITQQAAGVKEMAKMIGAENAAALMLQDKINEAAEKFTGPEIYVNGTGNSGEGLVSAHMISKAIKDMNQKTATAK